MTTFIDTSVLVAILKRTEAIHEWAVAELHARRKAGPAIISDIVFSEISVSMSDVAKVHEFIAELGLERYPPNDDAHFRAGRAFQEYKKNKGPKTGTLPDFFIGAIAEVENASLMTNNTKDFTTYFPTVPLICPPKAV